MDDYRSIIKSLNNRSFWDNIQEMDSTPLGIDTSPYVQEFEYDDGEIVKAEEEEHSDNETSAVQNAISDIRDMLRTQGGSDE